MNAREAAPADRDWWMPHVLIALFVMLVAAILRVVPGWSAPLHAWIALAGSVTGVLAAHAGPRAASLAVRRRARRAGFAASLATGLALAAATLLAYGRAHPVAIDDTMVDVTPPAAERPR